MNRLALSITAMLLSATQAQAVLVSPGEIYEAEIDLYGTAPFSQFPVITQDPNPTVQQYAIKFGSNGLQEGEGFILQALNAADEVLSTTTYTFPIPGQNVPSLGIGFGAPEATPPFTSVNNMEDTVKLRIQGTGTGDYDLTEIQMFVIYQSIVDINGTATPFNLRATPAASVFTVPITSAPVTDDPIVSSVPLPLPALMLTTALLGLGSFASRRKSSAAA